MEGKIMTTAHTIEQNERTAHTMHGMEADSGVLKITGWLTGVYFIIELGLGYYSGSIAVISDAFHTFSAVGGILVALVANRIAMRRADERYTFGFKRAEIAGALLNGVFLLLMAVYILWMGYQRLQNEVEIPTGPMFIAAIGGLITEFIAIGLMYKRQKDNLNMKGAFWHVLQTFVGSIIIIIAAVVIRYTGFLAIDPILGMLFGLVLLYASWGIIKETFDILLETAPSDVDIAAIVDALSEIDGVTGVRHPHAWTLTTGKNIFSAHIQSDDPAQSQAIVEAGSKLLEEKFNVYFSTLQVETAHRDVSADEIDIASTVLKQ